MYTNEEHAPSIQDGLTLAGGIFFTKDCAVVSHVGEVLSSDNQITVNNYTQCIYPVIRL